MMTLLEALSNGPLLGDGAMGTQLMFAGLEQGSCGEAWNLTHPERVLAIQRRYAEAGSDCILTNTFGGSRIMLNRHGHAEDVAGVNKAGGRNRARGVRRPSRLRHRRHRPLRRTAGTVRRFHRRPRSATRFSNRRGRWSTPAPTPSSSKPRRRSRNCCLGFRRPRRRGHRASSGRWPTTSRSTGPRFAR